MDMETDDIQLERIPEEHSYEPVRHRKRVVVVDMQKQIPSALMSSRIDNVAIECRPRVEFYKLNQLNVVHLLHRPVRTGRTSQGLPLLRLYLNKLNNLERRTLYNVPEQMVTEGEQLMPPPPPPQEQDISHTHDNTRRDLSILPTQIIPPHPKRLRTGDANESTNAQILNNENQSPNQPLEELELSRMLQEAGISDLPERMEPQIVVEETSYTKNRDSESPEGSLDRTQVSLGDTDSFTDSQKRIRLEWGVYNTMLRIFQIMNDYSVIDMYVLLSQLPIIPGYGTYTAAKCFTSLLKLKQHGFIEIEKHPNNEIKNIKLGRRFENM